MPSRGVTGLCSFEPPLRMGMPGKLLPPRRPLFAPPDACLGCKGRALFFHQSGTRASATVFLSATGAPESSDHLRNGINSHGWAAPRFNPIDAAKRQNPTEYLAPRALFPQPEDSENGGEDRKQVGERAQLGSFEIPQQPEVEHVGQRRTEDGHVKERRPGWPGKRPIAGVM